MIFYISIAWLQLIRQKVRFLVALAGLAFVAILLFMQLGFQDALYASAIRVHESLIGDIFLISPQYTSITSQQSFPRARLYQTLALDSVESVNSLYVQFGKLKHIETGEKNSIFVFGIDPGVQTFNLPEVNQQIDKLKVLDTGLYDRESRLEFGPIADEFSRGKPVTIEIAPFNELTFARKLTIAGLFTMGPSFGVDGNLIVNYLTFMNMFLERTPDQIDIGIISLKKGVDVQSAVTTIASMLPDDIRVLPSAKFRQLEKEYWAKRTPIGFTFSLMVTMGFIVGVVIVYQILYGNIANHLSEFATLKAIGHTNRHLQFAIFQQAAILAILGYIPGFFISLGLYNMAKEATKLPVIMNSSQAIFVLVSILLMSVVSGTIAMGKLRSADPADIF